MKNSGRRKLSMIAQDNDAKHDNVISRQETYQEDVNLKLQNENLQEYKELHEQIQTYFSSASEIWDQTFEQELDRMSKDAYSETLRYVAKLQSIFDISEEQFTDISRTCMLGWKRLGISHLEYFTWSQMITLTAFIRRGSRSWTFPVCCLFPVYPQTDSAHLYNMRTPHLHQIGL